MKSIVILGDVRAHQVLQPADTPASSTPGMDAKFFITGGAELMRKAIDQAMFSLDALSLPLVLGLRRGALPCREILGSESTEMKTWRLEKRQLEGARTKRYSLKGGNCAGQTLLPRPEEELLDRLASANGFHRGHTLNPNKELAALAPDVVVIDDLGQQIDQIRFALPSNKKMKSLNKFCKSTRKRLKRANKAVEKTTKVDQSQGSHHTPSWNKRRSAHERLTKETLRALISRLQLTANQVGRTGRRFPVEPVLLLSAGESIPNLTPKQGSKKRTVWQHVHGNETLCRRTVVLLDAWTLRDQISISSGLSWERTAQDTIIEFSRHHELKAFLKFGHVIIRFGVTGMLLISNDGNSDWTYTLYFNPDQDDVTWTHQEDGTVLGSSSILVATVVEELSKKCSWRNGAAILPDLRHALDQSLLLAVQRLWNHVELGYGEQSKDVKKRATGFSKHVFASRAEILQSDPSGKRSRIGGQKIKLLPFRSRHWSVLAQSCQSEIIDISRNIAIHGAKVTLNTIESPLTDFVKLWIKQALAKTREQSRQFSLLRADQLQKLGSDERTRILTSTLKSELVDPLDSAVRRLVGDAFSGSVMKLREELSKDNNRAEAFLSKMIATLAQRAEQFSEEITNIKNLLKSDKNSFKQFQRDCSEHTRGLIMELLDSPANCGNEIKIWTSYAFLRKQLTCGLKHPDAQAIRNTLADIESGGLHDPRALMQTEMENLIRHHEPHNGWPCPVSAPVLRLGKLPDIDTDIDKRLVVIDRKEVESIRAVKRMIEQFLRNTKTQQPARPLSIAVFGPPGAGKSVAVKKVIEMMSETGVKTELMTVNLAELPNIESLNEKLKEVVQKIANRKVPIVFFDEFDSPLNEKKYGWLKYFLAAMEDGEKIKSAVFVFAGGTCDTFEDFSLAERSRTDSLWAKFSETKGPDFVSRLSGHINVVGINPSGPDDDLHLIRRALTLRHLVADKQGLKDDQRANIDDNMLNAFLFVPEYIHGARSMRMLVDLCLNRDSQWLSMSEVPPIHQLDMQVDGKAFASLASGQTKPNVGREDGRK